MSIKKYFKTRNWTRKTMKEFRENLTDYLTPEECAGLKVRNELETFKPNRRNEHSRKKVRSLLQENRLDLSKSLMRQLSAEIRKEAHPNYFLFQEDPPIKGSVDVRTGYMVLSEQGCKPNMVLDLAKWAKRFPYFYVGTKEISPSGDKWLLSIDFLGSQTYHLFTKSMYSDEYKQIKIPQQTRLQTHQLLSNNERTSSEQAMWIDDTRILYATTNRYYNDTGLYMYDLETEKHKLLFKCKPGLFLRFDIVSSGLFLVISTTDYHSDEIYVMDLDTHKMSLLLPRKFSVSYPYINHEKGRWIVCKRDKNIDTLSFTPDFKKWDTVYKNVSPYEQILEVNYERDTFLFTLETLSGLCLYGIYCGKVKLLEKSFDSYHLKNTIHDQFIVHKCKYTCPYQILTVSRDVKSGLVLVSPPMKPRYHEEEVFIHPHLRVTLLYKKKGGPCVLRGYGAYNTYEHAGESPFYYPLIERGFVIAIAHLRGGGEYGYKGYDEGRMTHKKNTFQDFIDTAHYLVDKGWTTRDKLAIWGRSCGGLLISSVLNQEPDLCKVALVGVPFVTPMETMTTYKTPLGYETQSELGDVSKKSVRSYIHSYAPLEHIKKEGKYPHLFIYTNLNDTLVPYKEPLAYYHALKEVDVYKKGDSDLSFYMDTRFGHFQGSLLKDRCDHYAMLFAYLIKHLNV